MGIYKANGRSTYWMALKVNGKRIQRSTKTRDKKLADQVFEKWKHEVYEHTWLGKPIKTPLAELINLYMKTHAKPSKISWRDDEYMLTRFRNEMEHEVGLSVTIQDINPLRIESFRAHLKADGLSNARINRFLACIRTLFNKAIQWDKLAKNPVKGLVFYKEMPRTKALELGQIRALLDACSERLRPIVQVAVFSGLRQGDIFKLRWDNINFDAKIISLVQSKTTRPLAFQLGEPLASMLKSVPKYPDCPLVFSKNGKPLTNHGWVRLDFEKALKEAGIASFQFRDLRRTFGTQLARMGVNLKVIAKLMGHTSTRMTEQYVHVSQSTEKEALDQLGARIAGLQAANDLNVKRIEN